jgi:hypothetical protein
MKSWYAKLPDWRMLLAWLVLTFLATVIYFFQQRVASKPLPTRVWGSEFLIPPSRFKQRRG